MTRYKYDYFLPKELIANVGAEPRDSSRLMIVNTKTDEIVFDHYFNVHKYLPESSLMILNETKVVPARVELYKETGGKVEVFFFANEIKDKNKIPIIVDRKIEVNAFLYIKNIESRLEQVFKIISQEENKFYLQPVLENGEMNLNFYLEKFLEKHGKTPLPKYIKTTGESEQKNIFEKEIREKYQTIFAKSGMSVAAPTASLHFTERVFENLKIKNIDIKKIRLDVGFGTFVTPTSDNIKKGKIHTEPVYIKKEIIKKIENAKKEDRKIIAVGTTVVRSLESWAGNLPKANFQPETQEYFFDTDIFIYPSFDFKIIDIVQTNFHLPNTSLMMLVQAFLEYKGSKLKILDIYMLAIENKFRFYSLGDVMLII